MSNDYRDNGVKFAMTTKGIWFCSEIAVSTDDVLNAMEIANKAMKKANKILGQRNRFRKPKKADGDA